MSIFILLFEETSMAKCDGSSKSKRHDTSHLPAFPKCYQKWGLRAIEGVVWGKTRGRLMVLRQKSAC